MAKPRTIGEEGEMTDNFEFNLIGADIDPFAAYVSSIDPTVAAPNVMIEGSKNVYKKLSGTIAVRPGLKRRGVANAAIGGVKNSVEWETSLGTTRPMRVISDGATAYNLQTEYNLGAGLDWYNVQTGLVSSDVSFTTWYDSADQKEILLYVNGQQEINRWDGGIVVLGTASNAAGIIDFIDAPNNIVDAQFGQYSSGGNGYVVGDILTVSGGNADALLEVDSITAGGVVTASVDANGSGYSIGDIVKAGAGSMQALFKVTAIGGGGSVTSIQLLAAGVGNSAAVGLVVTNVAVAGSPSGLTITVTAVGNTIATWHFTNNGSGYSASAANSPSATTGGTGTGASVWIFSVVTGRVTVPGTDSIFSLGFSGVLTPTNGIGIISGGSFNVNGVRYSYTVIGDNGFSFLGFNSDPSGISGGLGVSTVVVTDTSENSTDGDGDAHLEANFKNDFLNTVGNQVHVGCYTSRLIHISSILHFDHYEILDLRAPGDPDLLVLDSPARAVWARQGNAVAFGSRGDSYLVTRTAAIYNQDNGAGKNTAYAYEQVVVDKEISSDLSSPASQEFIGSVGDTIVFLDLNNQLRQYGTVRNIVTPVYPILSLDVFDELRGVDFTGGHLRTVADEGGENVYITGPKTGVVYIYNVRYKMDTVGNLTAERNWHPPFVLSVSRIAVIDGETYGHSSANPQLYQVWNTEQYHDDSPSDDPLSYECRAKFAYRNYGRRQGLIEFDKLYVEGYVNRSTELNGTIYFDYRGSSNQEDIVVSNQDNPATFFGVPNPPSPGDESLGDDPLGDGTNDGGDSEDLLPKFRVIVGLEETECFEVCHEIWSDSVDAQWELLTLGFNAVFTANKPSELMQKN